MKNILTSEGAIIVYLIIAMLLIVGLVVLVMLSFRNKNSVERVSESRFAMLSEIDKELREYAKDDAMPSYTLKEFAEGFRAFAANELHLYYSIDDVIRFITNLSVSHIMILQGMSGTGKTSLAYAFGQYIQNDSLIVPVQPMWKERTDLVGYYNEFTKKFNETPFLKKLYEANYKNDMYITVLDEMNIARIEYYFAEFLSLLEIPNPEGRYLEVVSDMWKNDPEKIENGMLRLPENMWFIGTANNDDSTFSVSDKVYDRAMVMNLDKKLEPFQIENKKIDKLTFEGFKYLVDKAVKSYVVPEEVIAKLISLDEYIQANFYTSFGNRIMKQINAFIPVYVECGGSLEDALDDIVSKKIIRKLESVSSTLIKNGKDKLIMFINNLFGDGNMSITMSYIERIALNAK